MDVFSGKDGGRESGCEGVACTYGVGHFHFRGVSIGCLFRGEYEAASCAAGENQSLQRVSLQQRPASCFLIRTGQVEQTCHDVEFFVVDFKDVALLQTGGDDFLCVEPCRRLMSNILYCPSPSGMVSRNR